MKRLELSDFRHETPAQMRTEAFLPTVRIVALVTITGGPRDGYLCHLELYQPRYPTGRYVDTIIPRQKSVDEVLRVVNGVLERTDSTTADVIFS